MKKTFIRVVQAGDKAILQPLENLLSFHCDTNAKLSLTFKSSLPLNLTTIGTSEAAATKAYDEVVYSITADTEVAVMAELVHLINAGPHQSGIIDLGNEVTGVYPAGGITAVDSITLGVS